MQNYLRDHPQERCDITPYYLALYGNVAKPCNRLQEFSVLTGILGGLNSRSIRLTLEKSDVTMS